MAAFLQCGNVTYSQEDSRLTDIRLKRDGVFISVPSHDEFKVKVATTHYIADCCGPRKFSEFGEGYGLSLDKKELKGLSWHNPPASEIVCDYLKRKNQGELPVFMGEVTPSGPVLSQCLDRIGAKLTAAS